MRPIHTAICAGRRPFASTLFALAVLTLLFAGCGSGTPAPSGIQHRIFVTNSTGSGSVTPPNGVQQPAGIEIINASTDTLATSTAVGISGAAEMVSAGGTTGTTIVAQVSTNTISIVDNATEAETFTFGTTQPASDLAITSNADTAFVALRNPGMLDVITTSSDAGVGLNLPSATRLVISPNGTKLLAFVDNPQALVTFPANSFFVIDVASNSVTSIQVPPSPATCGGVACGDQPFSAVFNGSETKAFILNCGAECGGTTTTVLPVDFSGSTPVFGTPIPVAGATVGLLNGSNLYVAGTPTGAPAGSGTLSVINTGNSTVSQTFTITDGLHQKMAMVPNNRLYIGANACTPQADVSTGLTRGCLAIFNTSSSAVVFPEFTPVRSAFDVTGVTVNTQRNEVFVTEGGLLDIYSTTTDQMTLIQVDIIGNAMDVIQID